jgi:parallel beta-helix repeat protein
MRRFTRLPARARLAPAFASRTSAALLLTTLAACGGGADEPAGNASATHAAPNETRAQAQAITTTAASGAVSGEGWVAQLPNLPVMASGTSSAYAAQFEGRAYHVSPDGNDNNDGLSPQTPWRTIDRATNNRDSSRPPVAFNRGDAILLKCGGVWSNGEMVMSSDSNPTLNNGLLLAAYGCDGATPRPILSGASPLPASNTAAWVTPRTGVHTLLLTGSIKRLYRNGVPEMPARFPNGAPGRQFAPATLLPAVSNETQAQKDARDRRFFQITGSHLDAVKDMDLIGATVYVRTTTYTTETALIQAFDPATGVVELASSLAHPIRKNAGFVLEGKPWMVDQPGEWALEGNTLHYGSSSPPDRNQLSAAVPRKTSAGLDKPTIGLWLYKVDNLRVEHIRMVANDQSISLSASKNVTIRGIESAYADAEGIGLDASPGIQLLDNRIENSGLNGLLVRTSPDAVLRGNWVSGTGAYRIGTPIGAGVIKEGESKPAISFTGWGIRVDGERTLVDSNVVIDSANVGIAFSDKLGTIVRQNTVLNPCLVKTDCGGIYTSNETLDLSAPQVITSQILNNQIAGLKSNLDGAHLYGVQNLTAGENQANAIYLDDLSTTVEVSGNLIAGAEVGIYLHNSAYNVVRNNVARQIGHASLLVSSDSTSQPWITRGNRITGNTLFSRRTVDGTAFGNTPYLGVRGQPTYAQLWLHATQDSGTHFKDSAPGANDRNVSSGNTVLSLTKVSKPAIWRMEAPDRKASNPALALEQVSGGVWGLRTMTAPYQSLGLSQWLALIDTTATPDAESSPVSYVTHKLSTGPELLSNPAFGNNSLTKSWTPTSGSRSFISASTCPLKTTCARYRATGVDDRLASNEFSLAAGVLYATAYTVKGSSSDARHSAHLGLSTTPQTVFQTVTPLLPIKGNSVVANAEERRFETFVKPSTAGRAVLALRASDGSNTWFNKDLFFATASVAAVNGVSVSPATKGLGVAALNASNTERTFSCAELGLSSTVCPSRLLDAQGLAITAAKVPAGSVGQFFLNLTEWRATN